MGVNRLDKPNNDFANPQIGVCKIRNTLEHTRNTPEARKPQKHPLIFQLSLTEAAHTVIAR